MNLRAGLAIVALILTTAAQNLSSQSAPATVPGERNYTLEATMLGFRGVGGEIDGIRNPTLWALTGETVRITIVNGELMVHDIALEKLNVKSAQILDKGVSTSITFKAKANDTYFCSVPGHRAAGMEGRIEVSDAPRVPPEGDVAGRERATAQSRFRVRHARELDGDRRRLRGRERPGRFRNRSTRQRAGRVVLGQQQAGGNARKGTLSSAPFRVTQPYASFLDLGRRVRKHARRAGASPATTKSSTRSPAPTTTCSGRRSSICLAYVGQGHLRPRWSTTRPARRPPCTSRRARGRTSTSTTSGSTTSKPFFPNEITPSETATLPPMDPVPHAGLSGAEAAAGDDRAEGLHRQARGGRAGRRAADRLHARRPRPALGRRRRTPIRCARRKARARIAS